MRFVEGGASRTGRWYVPRLDGGENARDGAQRIADNQLAECVNLWWKDGALRPRPGIRREGDTTRTMAAGLSRLISREEVSLAEEGQRRTLRRFVERVPGTGTEAAYTLGTLYRDGELVYSPSLTLSGAASGTLANTHGLAVDTAAGEAHRVLVFFGCGRIYELKNGSWQDISGEAYVPRLLFGGRGTASAADTPPTDGVRLESRNLLTPKFRALYTTDGKSSCFFLPLNNLSGEVDVRLTGASGTVSHVIPASGTVSPTGTDGYAARVDRSTGCVTILNSSGQAASPPYFQANNLDILASRDTPQDQDRIFGMTFHTWFSGSPGVSQEGARLFLGGNARYPHLVHWSAFGDPLYFPEYNYSYVGRADEAVTGFGQQGDTLAVFKEHSVYGVDYVLRPMSEAENLTDLTVAAAYFPVTQLTDDVGCDAPLTICRCGGRLLWGAGKRVYMLVSVDSSGRGSVRALSGLIDRRLAEHSADVWSQASAGTLSGRYLLQAGNRIYVLQAQESRLLKFSRATTDEQAEKQLGWCRWETDESLRPVFLLAGDEEAAMLGLAVSGETQTAGGYRLDGETDTVVTAQGGQEQDVAWKMASKEYDFGYPDRGKAILSVQAGLLVDNLRTVRFTYVTEEGDGGEDVPVAPDGGWLRRLPGSTRVRRFGIRLEGSGNAELDGLAIYYRLSG